MGSGQALLKAGCMYLSGIECEKDYEKAFDYLTRADESRVPDAGFYLGSMYIQGQFVEEDAVKGIDLISQAAEHGSKPAREFLEKRSGGDGE